MNPAVRRVIFQQFLYDTLLAFERDWAAMATDIPLPRYIVTGPITVRPYNPAEYWDSFLSDFIDAIVDGADGR